MNKETLEEAAKKHEIDFATTASLSDVCVSAFKAGAEWQRNKMEEEMIKFSEFVSENYPNQTNYLRNLRRFNRGEKIPPKKLIGYYTTKELLEKFKKQ